MALTYSKNRTMRWKLLDIKSLFVALRTQYFPSMMNCREALLSSVDLTPPLASCELSRELSTGASQVSTQPHFAHIGDVQISWLTGTPKKKLKKWFIGLVPLIYHMSREQGWDCSLYFLTVLTLSRRQNV